MKEFLKKFRLPIIIALVIIIFIIAAAIIGLVRNQEKQIKSKYFDDSYYPVDAKENVDGSLDITLDGSRTPELKWSYEITSPELIEVTKKVKEQDGILTIRIAPLSIGYPEIVFLREGDINGYPYTAGEIITQLLVSEKETGKLSVGMSDIYQHQSYVGAADSETPFLVQGDRILLLNGGDWDIYRDRG